MTFLRNSIAAFCCFFFTGLYAQQELSVVTDTIEVCDDCTPNSITTTGNISWTWVHDTSGRVAVYRSDQAPPINFGNAQYEEMGEYHGTSGSIANICVTGVGCAVFDAALLPRVPISIPDAPMIPGAPNASVDTQPIGVVLGEVVLGFTGNIATSYQIGDSAVEDISTYSLGFTTAWFPQSSNNDLSIIVGSHFDLRINLRPYVHNNISGNGTFVGTGVGSVTEIGTSPFGQDTILGTENGQSFYTTVSANGTPSNPSFVPGVSEFLEITSEGIVVRLDTGECAIAYPDGGSVTLTAPFGSNCIDATETENGVISLLEEGGVLVTEVRVVDVMDYTSVPLCNGRLVTVDLSLGQIPTAGSDVILGTPGNDDIFALGGNDTICGMGGDDVINAGGGNDWIDGGNGNDNIQGSAGIDTIFGGLGNDVILGGVDNDEIEGEEGDDALFGQGGDDVLDGGPGVDDIKGGSGNDTIYTGPGATVGSGVFVSGGSGNDMINGGADADDLRGVAGVDTINGKSGDDIITGGNGRDTINGGPGNDTLSGQGSRDTINGDAGNDTINGGDENDTVNGGNGDDVIAGGPGNDVLRGDSGADTVSGGSGDDTLVGGPSGGDVCNGQSGIDTADGSCELVTGVP